MSAIHSIQPHFPRHGQPNFSARLPPAQGHAERHVRFDDRMRVFQDHAQIIQVCAHTLGVQAACSPTITAGLRALAAAKEDDGA
jgi:hypothetical protein